MLLESINTYFDDAPYNCVMVCPFCPAGDNLVNFRREDEQARCERCRRTYRLMTRKIGGPTMQTQLGDDAETVRYRVLLDEPSGRQRMQSFTAKRGAKLLHGEWITLVWHGAKFIGVANQTGNRFVEAGDRESLHTPYRPAFLATFAVAGALSLMIGWQAVNELWDVVLAGSLTTKAIIVGILAILAVPFVRWAIQPMRVRANS